MTVLQSRERCAWGLSVICCYLGLLTGAAAVAGPPAAGSTPPPFSFAPTPFALPVASASLDRQITGLLRGFGPIQRSEVLVSGDAGRDLSVQIIVQLRRGERLDAVALANLVQLILSAVPGLQASRLNIAASDGQMLVRGGQPLVQAAPPPVFSPPLLLLGVLVLVAVGATAGLLAFSRGRKRAPVEPLDQLILEQGGQLARALRHERPELCGVIVDLAGPRAARRLERQLRAERITTARPSRAPDARVRGVLVRELQERLGGRN